MTPSGADDVTYVESTGAPHYLHGHRREAADLIVDWLRDPQLLATEHPQVADSGGRALASRHRTAPSRADSGIACGRVASRSSRG